MKKTNNKGFSLVELIIVIAIMAILAGAIAPALIRYIDKSRRSNDVTAAKTIKTAVETALGNEKFYEALVPSATEEATVFAINDTDNVDSDNDDANAEILESLGGKGPKVKFSKWGQSTFVVAIDNKGNVKVYTAKAVGSVTAAVAAIEMGAEKYATDDTSDHGGTYWLLTPEVNEFYQ